MIFLGEIGGRIERGRFGSPSPNLGEVGRNVLGRGTGSVFWMQSLIKEEYRRLPYYILEGGWQSWASPS